MHKTTFMWTEGASTRIQDVGSSRSVPAGGPACRPVPFTLGACLHDLNNCCPFESTACLRTAQCRTSTAAALKDRQRTEVSHDHIMACCTAALTTTLLLAAQLLRHLCKVAFSKCCKCSLLRQTVPLALPTVLPVVFKAAMMALVQIHGCADKYMATYY